jgi:RsmE family RNA methyltransferase
MNLILIDPSELTANETATLSGDRARHARDVLKIQVADTIRVGIIDGPIGTGTVAHVGNDTVTLQCVWDAMPSRPRVDLLLALPRPKVLRRLWAQLAALGVGRIILTNAERVERNYFDTHLLTPEVYRPLLIEGLQQARDTHLPQVSIHRKFRILIEDELDRISGAAFRVVADPRATMPLRDVLASVNDRRILLAVGPEGGWNAFELDLLAARGFEAAGIGPRTLRTDTACIVLLGIVSETTRTMSSLR